MIKIEMDSSWLNYLSPEFEKDYMKKLVSFLKKELELGKIIYPRESEIFTAFNYTPFDDVKVVILGQDPYHGAGEAHGLSFSVNRGVKIPPSLKNIYKELKNDIGFIIPDHGSLVSWAKQGVLLLNVCLTVEKDLPASHKGKGWEIFTDKVIELLSRESKNLVFVLWGSFAQSKSDRIDCFKHLVLKSVHPSPLSASRGFFGNKHFSKINEYLVLNGKVAIDWTIN